MKAGFAADTLVLELQAEHWASLSNAWEAWLEALEAQSFTPSVCVESGSYSVLGAFPDAAPANSLHALLRGYYAPVQGEQDCTPAALLLVGDQRGPRPSLPNCATMLQEGGSSISCGPLSRPRSTGP